MAFRDHGIRGLAAAMLTAIALHATPAAAVQEPLGFELRPGFGLSNGESDFFAPAPIVASRPQSLTAVPTKRQGSDLGVFNSVAISVASMPALDDWKKIHESDYTGVYRSDCDFGAKICNSRVGKAFRQIAASASVMTPIDTLKFVNSSVNRAITYRDDRAGWGQSDYWADPTEIAARGIGDCEDFAIAKMWMLRSLGFDENELQLVVLKNTRSGIFHAVLAVHVDGKRYVLDNLSNNIGTDDLFVAYVPIVSFAGEKSYLHGFRNKRATVATSNGLGSIFPND